jgi:hypothetical protein
MGPQHARILDPNDRLGRFGDAHSGRVPDRLCTAAYRPAALPTLIFAVTPLVLTMHRIVTAF